MITSLAAPAQDSMQPAYGTLLLFNPADDGTYATAVPPVMYCDVYLNGKYYKTLSSSSPKSITGIHSIWQFAIEGVVQEFMQSYPQNDITNNTFAPQAVVSFSGPALPQSYLDCYCKFRLSSIDSFGVITPEGPVPVQGTIDSAPVAGGGYASPNFLVVNAALQWNTDPFSLENLLKKYRLLSTSVGVVNPAYRVYGLSKVQKIKVYTTDYGRYNFVTPRYGFNGADTCSVVIRIVMISDTGVPFVSTPTMAATLFSGNIYMMPCGLANLSALLPTIVAHIPDAHHYFIIISNTVSGAIIFRTPDFVIQNRAKKPSGAYYNPAPPAHKRIYFQNYLGQLDMINFIESEESIKVTSGQTERPNYSTQPLGITRTTATLGRNNVRSNEFCTLIAYVTEDELQNIKELAANRQAYIESPSPDFGYLAATNPILLPIVFTDGEIITYKFEDRYEYAIMLKYYMSNEIKTLRS